jgi:ABC-type dipeptide/oligopeptide/nickel transport system permease component
MELPHQKLGRLFNQLPWQLQLAFISIIIMIIIALIWG